MSEIVERLADFVSYRKLLKGDEKGEAQVFCDRLFKAFGHAGYKESGAELEFRIKAKDSKGTSFADLVWKPKLLLEMKKAGENLLLHYKQAFDYWINAVPDRPRYVVLCNFDEFWVYDFDIQLNEPVDKIAIRDLPQRYAALNFLFDGNKKPIFGNDLEAASRKTADQIADLYQRLITRKVDRAVAQRFVLQIIVSMFAEDIDLLPKNTVTSLVSDCLATGQSSYDLFGALFRQMDSKLPATGGRFAGVPYFNGGLFQKVEPVELTIDELNLVGGPYGAATANWNKVDPVIFGSIFQHSMDAKKRHAYGAHYTHEADILRIIIPTIVRPWQNRIENASTAAELRKLRTELTQFRVLDPACGSGNFLYVAFRELVRLETQILLRLRQTIKQAGKFEADFKTPVTISPRQFFGIELDEFGADLAKVTLMIAKKLATDESRILLGQEQHQLGYDDHDVLPLDNLDSNILSKDALFNSWPESDVVIGNPPYQSKNKLQEEMGLEYVNKLRDAFPEIDGRSDYCVYWFRKAHDHLKDGQRAGLVGTNTIRQNYTRESGLDYIVQNGGQITEAVSSMIWPDEAAVHVSIVNWINGKQKGDKRLYIQDGNDVDSGWRHEDLPVIGPSLSFNLDVTKAKTLKINTKGGCYQGQTHGHAGFLIPRDKARLHLNDHPEDKTVLFPFLTANEMIGRADSKALRYVIDFHGLDQFAAQSRKLLYQQVEKKVLPTREAAAKKEVDRNKKARTINANVRVNQHHTNFLNHWWALSYAREDMIEKIGKLSRYVVCGRVTKRPIFEFLPQTTHPNDALQIFAFEDDYSFGILQSSLHWNWFQARCSTLKSDFRYTSNTVFDSFPWPQTPGKAQVKAVADASRELRAVRHKIREQTSRSLREIYRTLDKPGKNPLSDAHAALDAAVNTAYGNTSGRDALNLLLELNLKLAEREAKNQPIFGPGVPASYGDFKDLISADFLSN